MIKLLGPKTTRVEEGKGSSSSGHQTVTPGLIRLQKDLSSIELPKNAQLQPKTKADISVFDVIVKPEDVSYWYGATYNFTITVPSDFPHVPPKVHCNTPIYHPNIDLQGNVCLNILRSDWTPVLTIENVVLGLLFLFIDPNPNDPLNDEAAKKMREDPTGFKDFVKRTLKGMTHKDIIFPKLI